MQRWFTILLLLLVGYDAAPAAEKTWTLPPEARADIQRVKGLLSNWEEQAPQKGKRLLRVIYWTPADTEPAPQYRERLTRVMKFVQNFYARQMETYGLGARTIGLELEPNGLLKLRVAHGSKPFDSYGRESGSEIRRDCVPVFKAEGLDCDNETIVIFCNLSRWDAVKRTMRQTSPYYASGTHRNGTAWQVDSPLLDPDLIPERAPMLMDGEYGRISVGRYNSIFVGGVAHELGHALGLPHCREAQGEKTIRGTALMGSGNRTMGEELRGESLGSFLTLPHALKLASHPQFSGSVKRMMDPAQVIWTNWSFKASETNILVAGCITGQPPVYLVIGYADPEGHGDYNSTLGYAVPDAEGHFTVSIPAPKNYQKSGEIRIVAVCANGAATGHAYHNARPAFPFRFTQGHVDLGPALVKLELESALAKAKTGQLTAREMESLQPLTREIIRRQLAPDSTNGKPEPREVSATNASVILSDCRPASAATGWAGVHYDRLAENGGPLMSDGELYATGIYAHAPATHRYQLGKSWKTLTGRCGIADGHAGSVEFVILGDGKELWQSGAIKAGKSKSFTVTVGDINQLELKTRGATNSLNGTWGLWLEPELRR